ncbi:hypothetical protein DRP53_03725 [candidate division WOR-3 bacterium]|uniref:PAS domain S-box protein n=1 Tax=candidate division WOR-3 bacterium TaxID=2052148 RepID=A0A660SLC0_UNCW3|nr:MAG: hypothetical protein DRP53_03725 [candidate division WOR-3 bacterium]
MASEGSERARRFVHEDIFLDTIPYLVYALSNKFKILYCNDAGAQFLGRAQNELLDSHLFELYPELDDGAFRRAVRTHLPQEADITYGGRYFRLRIFPLSWGLLVVGHDITHWRRIAELYTNLVERPHYGVVIVQGREPRIVFANEVIVDFLGYSKEELLNLNPKKLLEIIHEDDRPMVRERYQKRLVGEDIPSRYEMRVVRKSGEVRWVEVSSKGITYNGSPAVQATFIDITERKNLEVDWKALFNAMDHPALILDRNHRIIDANTKAVEFLNKTIGEIIGEPCYKLYHGNEKPPEECPFERAVKTNAPGTAEVSFGPEGKGFLITCVPISDRILHIANPITGEMETESELSRERAYLKSLFESAQEAVVLGDNEGKIIDVNHEFTRIFGYSREEAIGRNADYLIAGPEERGEARRLTEETFAGRSVRLETIRRRKDGTPIYVSLIAAPIKVDDEQIGVYAIYRDITERKRMEQALLESERKYRTLVEQSLQGIAIIQDKRIVYANEALAKISGYTVTELLELSPEGVQELVYPDDRGMVWGRMEERLAGRKVPSHYEFRVIRKDGKVRWLEVFIQLIEYNGRPAAQTIVIDITDRKQTEEVVGRLATFPDQNPHPIIETDLEGNITYLNPRARHLFGDLPQLGMKHKILQGLRSIINDFKKGIHDSISREIDTGEAIFEQTICYVPKSNLIRIFCFDVTQRKKAEEDLQRSLAKLEQTINNTLEAMAKVLEARDPYTAGHQNRVAKLAKAIAEEMGLSRDQIQGLFTAAMIHDIGKIYVPAEILTRPKTLSESEFALIQTHPNIGYEILKTIDFPWPVAEIVLQHHERWNGSGYPQGLKDTDIMIEARILAVADVVEAMSSHRPYRPAKGLEATLEEISQKKGILYDPEVVDACLKVIKKRDFKF